MRTRWCRIIFLSVILGTISSAALTVLGALAMDESSGKLGSFRVNAIRETSGQLVIWSGNTSILADDFTRFTQFNPKDFGLPIRSPWWISQIKKTSQYHTTVCMSGWPLRALMGYSRHEMCAMRDNLDDMVEFDMPGRRVRLPTHIRWSAAIINCAIHSLAWIPLLLCFAHIRRDRRARRGLCPLCTYDLRHNLAAGCPECGWNRSPAPSPQA